MVLSHPCSTVVGMKEGTVNGLSGNRAGFVPPSMPVGKASLEGLQERMRSASQVEAQAAAVRAEAAAEYQHRVGQSRAEKTLREESGQSTRKSRAEVETGAKLRDLSHTSDAFRKGKISFDHARIIAKTAERVQIDEKDLVGKATSQPVDVFAHTARKHEQERSGDDGVSRLKQQRQDRGAWIKTDPGSGMTVLHARFDPITGARVKNALSQKINQLWRAEDPKRRPSTTQRMADALAELLCRTGDQESAPRGTSLVLIAHYDTVLQQIKDARLGDGTPIPVEAFKDMACQAKILPAIFDSKGQPLWVGRSRRRASSAQKMLLIARDRGCVGCGADPTWCQAHHIVPWAAEGPTDIDNMCLLCSRCHHRVHDEGWEIHQNPGGEHVLQPPPVGNRRSLPIKTHRPRRRRRKPTTKLLL